MHFQIHYTVFQPLQTASPRWQFGKRYLEKKDSSFFPKEVYHSFSVAQTHVNTVILIVVHEDTKFMIS